LCFLFILLNQQQREVARQERGQQYLLHSKNWKLHNILFFTTTELFDRDVALPALRLEFDID
jgi:hypothetical protein